ncbi:filamentous hemagglutinin N-terminal domain-containing protein, partial [Rivularia sp. UHCC 0363]|uniref:filamentous hemagglutinin N-terminal domain-containing protein n=1 Tax=Rivularia sp. UHCC 0363 TaxID=3110244 RepID=UPI002B20AE9C
MKKYGLNKCFQFGFAGLLGWLIVSIFTVKTQAQQSNITPDNTLGTESSRLNRNVIINGINADSIDGGAQRDINLFHSFSEFNINDGQTVYFVNPSGVENILTRVTGRNASNIFGTLGVDGAANLFLINPNGIVFGENARLDVQGSFVGSTASRLQFGEQGNFSATNPEAPVLLTINPSALFFDAVAKQGVINVNQSLLGVAPGKNLALVGGDISLNSTTLQAFGGNLELAAIGGTGTVGINKNGSFSLPENLTRANTSISNSLLDVAADNGGSITINANNLDISRSIIRAGILSGLGTVDSQAGDITINTTGILQIAPQSYIINWVFPNAIGKGGDIRINTDSMSTNNNNLISASTLGKGDAGNIIVEANNDIVLNGSYIYSLVEESAKGNAGNVDISANNLLLTNGGRLNSSTFGEGNGGNINIEAQERVSVVGTSENSNVFSAIG